MRWEWILLLLAAPALAQNAALPPGHTTWVNAVAFSPDGKLLASAAGTRMPERSTETLLWDVAQRRVLRKLEGHKAEATDVAFSPDGRTFATASLDNTVIFWGVDGRRVRTVEGHEGGVHALAISPDGTLLATGDEANVRLWEIGDDVRQRWSRRRHIEHVTTLTFSPDGKTLASGGIDGEAVLWSVDDGLPTELSERSDLPVFDLAFSPNGATLAIAAKAGFIEQWPVRPGGIRASTGPKTFVHHPPNTRTVAYSPDGAWLVASLSNGDLFFWDTTLPEPELTLKLGADSLAFSPDGRTLAGTSGRDIRTLEVPTWKEDRPFAGAAKP